MKFVTTDDAFEAVIKAGREHVRCLQHGLAESIDEADDLSIALDVLEDFYVNNVSEE